MIETESDYKASLGRMEEKLKKLKPTDLHIRYLYRHVIEDQGNGRKNVEFDTENVEMKDGIRDEVWKNLQKEFENKKGEKISLHNDYKLNFKIDDGHVGILSEEDYPEELQLLIS